MVAFFRLSETSIFSETFSATNTRRKSKAMLSLYLKDTSWLTLLTMQKESWGRSLQWKVTPKGLFGEFLTNSAWICIAYSEEKASDLMTAHKEWTSANDCYSNMLLTLVSQHWCRLQKKKGMNSGRNYQLPEITGPGWQKSSYHFPIKIPIKILDKYVRRRNCKQAD
jgi:hypothetical protein